MRLFPNHQYIDFLALPEVNLLHLKLPSYATPLSSGMDLHAYLINEENKPCDLELYPGQRYICDTGLKCVMHDSFEGQIRSKSGLAAKYGIIVLNSPGTIDSDYEGPIKVILYNSSKLPHTIKHGDKIAQFVLCPVYREPAYVINNKERGEGSFGSTGV